MGRLNGPASISSFPASILEKSRMSFNILSSASAEYLMASMRGRSSPPSVPSRARLAMPMIPFIGVRISWLMFARNSPLSRLACSARSFASASARFSLCSCRFRSPILTKTKIAIINTARQTTRNHID